MPSVDVLLNSVVSGILLGGILALTALGLSLVLGVMRLVNLAHGEFLIAGSYLAYFLLTLFKIDPLLGVPLVAVIAALIAFPIQRFLLMPVAAASPEAPMMTTFGISIFITNAFILAFSGDTRSIGTAYATTSSTVGPITFANIYAIGFAFSIAIIAAVHFLVTRTPFGRDLRASAVDPEAAAVMGVNVRRVYAYTFALGAACAAVGGTLIGIAFSFTPTSGAGYLLTDFAIVVLGGLGSIAGTLMGGIVLGVLESIGGTAFGDGYRDLVGLVVFLIVLAVRPAGLLSGRRSV